MDKAQTPHRLPSEPAYTGGMSVPEHAASIVADYVLAEQDMGLRREMALQLAAHAVAVLVAMDGKESAATTAYRIADSVVASGRK